MIVLGDQLGMSPASISHMTTKANGPRPRFLNDETKGFDQHPNNHDFIHMGRRWICSG
jgi:hypothetical protein